MIQTILVPQGAEYRAVCRGLRRVTHPPAVVAIPIGMKAVTEFLQRTSIRSPVLVTGLCGSLTSDHGVGDWVIYQQCHNLLTVETLQCDRALTQQIQARIKTKLVNAVTSDRVISSVQEKQFLAKTADVVDMEGFAVLAQLPEARVTMLRVVSDDCQHELPNLAAVFSPSGQLLPAKLAWEMVQKPIAAWHLIRGSLRSLHTLQNVTHAFFCDDSHPAT